MLETQRFNINSLDSSALILGVIPDTYAKSLFPILKTAYSQFAQNEKVNAVGFTTIRNQSEHQFTCGRKPNRAVQLDPGMSALFVYTNDKAEIKIQMIYGNPPILHRTTRTLKYNEHGELINTKENYYDTVNDKNLIGYLPGDSTITITEAKDDELHDLFNTFDRYIDEYENGGHDLEYNFHRELTPEFEYYRKDPEEYKDRAGRSTLMAEVNW